MAKSLVRVIFFSLLVPAWRQAMAVSQIQNGFRKTGIYPVNFEAIDKAKFTLVKSLTVRNFLRKVFNISLHFVE